MAIDSDQNEGTRSPSELSRLMLQLRDEVFSEWERRLREEVQEASHLPRPILIDTFPALYQYLTEAVTKGFRRASADVSSLSVAFEHGSERARLTGYQAKSVIVEYQLLRTAILEVLLKHSVPIADDELQIIISTFDTNIQEAATAFTLAQSAFREQFVASLAHDIRNPLSAAHGLAQAILLIDDRERIRDFSQRIVDNLTRIDNMVREMLDAVVFEHGARLTLDPECFNIADLVSEVCRESAIPNIEINGSSVQGWWDRRYLKRAMENLISNAVKYGSPRKPIRVNTTHYGGRLILSVHNEGDPIPLEQMETLFQVFRRAKEAKHRNKEGWGIGLPFVRAVAEGHGGSVDMASSKERGTTASIDIPIDSRPFLGAPSLG